MGNYIVGIIAEYITIILYKCKFYKILHHRYNSKLGEIDIIAARGNLVVFIEVKARKHGIQEGIISFKQQQRIKRSAEYFLAKNSKFINYDVRFDLVVISLNYWPTIIKNAF